MHAAVFVVDQHGKLPVQAPDGKQRLSAAIAQEPLCF